MNDQGAHSDNAAFQRQALDGVRAVGRACHLFVCKQFVMRTRDHTERSVVAGGWVEVEAQGNDLL